MRSPYICASCRQLLYQRHQTFARTQWRSKADQGAFSNLLPPSENSIPNLSLPTRRQSQKGENKQQHHRDGARQNNLSWNLEELFAGKLGPGRYSSAFLPKRSDAASKHLASFNSDSVGEGDAEKKADNIVKDDGKALPVALKKDDSALMSDTMTVPDASDRLASSMEGHSIESVARGDTFSFNSSARGPFPRAPNSHRRSNRLKRPTTAVFTKDIWNYISENPGPNSLQEVRSLFEALFGPEAPAIRSWNYILEYSQDIQKLAPASKERMAHNLSTKLWLAWRWQNADDLLPGPCKVFAKLAENGLPITDAQTDILWRMHIQLANSVTPCEYSYTTKDPISMVSETMNLWKFCIEQSASKTIFKRSSQGLADFEWSDLPYLRQQRPSQLNSKTFHDQLVGIFVPDNAEPATKIRVAASAFLFSVLYRQGLLATHTPPHTDDDLRLFTDFVMEISQESDVDLVLAYLEMSRGPLEKSRTGTIVRKILHDAGYRSTWCISSPSAIGTSVFQQDKRIDPEFPDLSIGELSLVSDSDALGKFDDTQEFFADQKDFATQGVSMDQGVLAKYGSLKSRTEKTVSGGSAAPLENPLETGTISSQTIKDPEPDIAHEVLSAFRTSRRSVSHSRVVSDSKARSSQVQISGQLIEKFLSDQSQDSDAVDESSSHNATNQHKEPEWENVKRQLGRALEKTDLTRVNELWQSTRLPRQQPQGQDPTPSKSNEVYESFIFTYVSLGAPDKAIDVWNTMVHNGVKPTVTTWTSMMQGCRHERDVESLEAIWQRMRNSGVQPDATAWNTRLYGLIRSGKVKEGLQRLQEMSDEWAAASQRISANPSQATEVDKAVPKPNIKIINAVITTLSRGPQEKAIQDVLAWAAARDIKPDAFTFNAQITLAFRKNDTAAAFHILQQMSEQNVQPDIATFTILLDNLIKDPAIAQRAPDEQQDIVMRFLHDLESRGLAPTAKSYNILIDRLLKNHDNVPAARAILSHMASLHPSLPPNPHLYTILITHYFTRFPPDIAAVDALWRQMQDAPNTQPDRVFYDRMVEGYADAGEVGKMMACLARTTRDRKQPGWWALAKVVRRLAEAGDWERCREVVREARKGDREDREMRGGGRGQRIGNWGERARAHFEEVVARELDPDFKGAGYRDGDADDGRDVRSEEDGDDDIGENVIERENVDKMRDEEDIGVLDERRTLYSTRRAFH